MTTPTDLTQRLRVLSGEQLSVAPAQLQPDASLLDDLGVDSLAAIEWGMSIEDVFGISLPEDSWERVLTYGMVPGSYVLATTVYAPASTSPSAPTSTSTEG